MAKATNKQPIRYIAFLRGINVSGQKIIKMTDLAAMFGKMKFDNVKTYIQSGNVLFDSLETNQTELTIAVEEGLYKALGYKVVVILRSLDELRDIISENPFKEKVESETEKFYVTLLAAEPTKQFELPLCSINNDAEVFQLDNLNAYCISRRINGKSGFPNLLVEKKLGVPATTRNWNTINNLAKTSPPAPLQFGEGSK